MMPYMPGEGGRYDAVYGWGIRGPHASANALAMGGSFRSAGEVLALCGCDRLTISVCWPSLPPPPPLPRVMSECTYAHAHICKHDVTAEEIGSG